MSLLPQKLQDFLASPQTKTSFMKIIKEMRLFPDWATAYWCLYIMRHPEKSPVELIEHSPFSSFFFKPYSMPAFISPLYMRIWGGVHMAYYIYQRDSGAVSAFIANSGIPREFAEVLENLQPSEVGQGEWKCDDCGEMPGYTNVCGVCDNPCNGWLQHVFSMELPVSIVEDPVGEVD
jgi:hypothetical protein